MAVLITPLQFLPLPAGSLDPRVQLVERPGSGGSAERGGYDKSDHAGLPVDHGHGAVMGCGDKRHGQAPLLRLYGELLVRRFSTRKPLNRKARNV